MDTRGSVSREHRRHKFIYCIFDEIQDGRQKNKHNIIICEVPFKRSVLFLFLFFIQAPLSQRRHHSPGVPPPPPPLPYCRSSGRARCYYMPRGPLAADGWVNAAHTSQLPSSVQVWHRTADRQCHFTIMAAAKER